MIVLLELLQLITHKGGWVKIARDVLSKHLKWGHLENQHGSRPFSVCSCDTLQYRERCVREVFPKYWNFLSGLAMYLKKVGRTLWLCSILKNVLRLPLSLWFIKDYSVIKASSSSCQRYLHVPIFGFKSQKSHSLRWMKQPQVTE